MFGYVQANLADLSDEEKRRYRAFYCGLCHALKKRHGLPGRMALSFDMTFLALFLSSLYEPEEVSSVSRCVTHPVRHHTWIHSPVMDYAADMTVALMYHKCRDDWQDDKNMIAKGYAALLKKGYMKAAAEYPRQITCMEESLKELSAIEERRDPSPDAAANCFGRLMGSLFLMKNDYWHQALRTFGEGLGRFVYMSDAACDYDKDMKKGSYNPVILMEKQPEDMREMLMHLLGGASAAFEALPLVQDDHLLRNILYSGVWQHYNAAMSKRQQGATTQTEGGGGNGG